MANPEHLAILEQGVDVWNRWRDENPGVVPDLNGVDLNKSNLSSANFSRADLRGANLRRALLYQTNFSLSRLESADLSETDLNRADFWRTSLVQTKFEKAFFHSTVINEANLSRANLNMAEFNWAILNGTHLIETDFRGVVFNQTMFADLDLSNAIGLESVFIWGPSTIGIDTIFKSKGQIPESFLRGCGVPDEFIQLIPSLTSQPVQYFSCFLSHSSLDKSFCERLYNDLRGAHVRTWYFPEDAKWGKSVWGEIDRSIRIYDKLVVICSENSLQSGPVLREIERALNREDREGKNVLFPIAIDEYVFEQWDHPHKDDVLSKVVGDFIGWDTDAAKYDKQFQRLLAALQAED